MNISCGEFEFLYYEHNTFCNIQQIIKIDLRTLIVIMHLMSSIIKHYF